MDLNKPINFSISLKGLDIANAKLPFVLSLISILGILILGFLSYGIYGNYEIHTASKSQYESLLVQKNSLKSQREKLFREHGSNLENLIKSPDSKSMLAALLGGLVTKNGLKLSKLNSNDTLASTGTKDAPLELEAEGQFLSIKNFLNQMRMVVLSSDIVHLKITKSLDNRALHLSLSIKFTKPPKLDLPKEKMAFIINGETYYYESFDDWKVYNAGFVQAPESSSSDKSKDSGQVIVPVDSKRADPFAVPPQPSINKDPAFNSTDIPNAQVPLKKSNIFFLSGIIYSNKDKYCVIVLPSGESKLFTEGEKVKGSVSIGHINDDSVTFSGINKTNQFKVGQELPL